MTDLLDANVLIARGIAEHPHHDAAIRWLASYPEFAVCPITEGAFVRYILRNFPERPRTASSMLEALYRSPGFAFWPADLSYQEAPLERIQGHKQVTDAYLVALAKAHGGRLATFDRALVAVHPEAVLVPTV